MRQVVRYYQCPLSTAYRIKGSMTYIDFHIYEKLNVLAAKSALGRGAV